MFQSPVFGTGVTMSVFHVGQSLLAAQSSCEKLYALNVPHSCHYIPARPAAQCACMGLTYLQWLCLPTPPSNRFTGPMFSSLSVKQIQCKMSETANHIQLT